MWLNLAKPDLNERLKLRENDGNKRGTNTELSNGILGQSLSVFWLTFSLINIQGLWTLPCFTFVTVTEKKSIFTPEGGTCKGSRYCVSALSSSERSYVNATCCVVCCQVERLVNGTRLTKHTAELSQRICVREDMQIKHGAGPPSHTRRRFRVNRRDQVPNTEFHA